MLSTKRANTCISVISVDQNVSIIFVILARLGFKFLIPFPGPYIIFHQIFLLFGEIIKPKKDTIIFLKNDSFASFEIIAYKQTWYHSTRNEST